MQARSRSWRFPTDTTLATPKHHQRGSRRPGRRHLRPRTHDGHQRLHTIRRVGNRRQEPLPRAWFDAFDRPQARSPGASEREVDLPASTLEKRKPLQTLAEKAKNPRAWTWGFFVELRGIEPLTSSTPRNVKSAESRVRVMSRIVLSLRLEGAPADSSAMLVLFKRKLCPRTRAASLRYRCEQNVCGVSRHVPDHPRLCVDGEKLQNPWSERPTELSGARFRVSAGWGGRPCGCCVCRRTSIR